MAGGTAEATAPKLAERLIAAYSQRYRESAIWKTLIWVGSAVLFAGALVTALFSRGAAVLGLIGSCYLLGSRLVLRPEMTRAHREGVVLQEQYDIETFGMGWNRGLAGNQVPLVDVEALADRRQQTAQASGNWYVATGNAPKAAAVLLCQLENVSWGRRDHRRFFLLAVGSLALSVAATVATGLIRDVTLSAYVSTLVAPSLPWLLDLADLSVMHWGAAVTRGEIEADLTAGWNELAGDGSIPEEFLRETQDRIFIVRRRFGRVPTWFYRLYRNGNERAFGAAVERMLDEKGWG